MANSHPFTCGICDQAPDSAFTIYQPVDDWLIAFPEKNLMHIHFGESTHDDKSNVEEAEFHWKWVQEVVKKNPHTQFFYVLDMSRKDDSEFLTKEARDTYKKIRTHVQLPAGAVYGFTWGMRMLIGLLNVMGGNTAIVDTPQQAQKSYEAWLKTARS